MKRDVFLLIIVFLASVGINSCSKDVQGYDDYNFIDQDLAGEISGTSWIYRTGNAFYIQNDSSQQMLDIGIYEKVSLFPCSYAFSGNDVLFIIPNKVGLYELNLDFENSENNQTLTLSSVEQENLLVTEGAIEIIFIDTIQKIVRGRIAAKYDNNNFVNGIFEVAICE